MAGPIDARKNPTQVDRVATTRSLRWFEMTAIQRVPAGEPGFLRKVYPGFLQLTAFVSLNVGRHADAHRRLYRDLLAGDEESAEVVRRFYDDYLAVMDLPAEYYLQTIASVFQRSGGGKARSRWRRFSSFPRASSATSSSAERSAMRRKWRVTASAPRALRRGSAAPRRSRRRRS